MPDAAAVRRVVVSALGTPSLDPGQSVTLQASGYTGLDDPASAIWAWTQVGGGTSWPSTASNPIRGSFCCRARDTITWVTELGRARSGTVTVTAAAGNGVSGTFPVVIRNVPPVLDFVSVGPLVAGDPAGTAITVARGTAITLWMKFHDDNGALEEPPAGDQWHVAAGDTVGYNFQAAWRWDGGAWQSATPLLVDASGSFTFLNAGTTTITWTFADGPINKLIRSWEVTVL